MVTPRNSMILRTTCPMPSTLGLFIVGMESAISGLTAPHLSALKCTRIMILARYLNRHVFRAFRLGSSAPKMSRFAGVSAPNVIHTEPWKITSQQFAFQFYFTKFHITKPNRSKNKRQHLSVVTFESINKHKVTV